MQDKEILLTEEGLSALKAEHAGLVNTKRPVAVKRLARAKAQGDLKENSEYSAAVDELSFIDGRIAELEEIIRQAKTVKPSKKAHKTVQIGCKVIVQINGKREVFSIVGEWEADPREKKISYNSPLGLALAGKKKGEAVEVNAPVGKINYKIIDIR